MCCIVPVVAGLLGCNMCWVTFLTDLMSIEALESRCTTTAVHLYGILARSVSLTEVGTVQEFVNLVKATMMSLGALDVHKLFVSVM